MIVKKKGKQGFSSMDSEIQRALAKKGGITAHKKGTAHTWNSETARAAGKLGGKARQAQLAKKNEKK